MEYEFRVTIEEECFYVDKVNAKDGTIIDIWCCATSLRRAEIIKNSLNALTKNGETDG